LSYHWYILLVKLRNIWKGLLWQEKNWLSERFCYVDTGADVSMNGYHVIRGKNLEFVLSVKAPTGTNHFSFDDSRTNKHKICNYGKLIDSAMRRIL